MKAPFITTLIALSITFSFISCKKESKPVMLDGLWVEQSHRTDTLLFRSDISMLTLNRPRVMTGTFLIPKIGAGPYLYKDLKDSIQLQYSLSSMYSPKSYKYSIKNNMLYIDDFYEKSSATLIFVKLK